jgi:hypothetical protein
VQPTGEVGVDQLPFAHESESYSPTYLGVGLGLLLHGQSIGFGNSIALLGDDRPGALDGLLLCDRRQHIGGDLLRLREHLLLQLLDLLLTLVRGVLAVQKRLLQLVGLLQAGAPGLGRRHLLLDVGRAKDAERDALQIQTLVIVVVTVDNDDVLWPDRLARGR